MAGEEYAEHEPPSNEALRMEADEPHLQHLFPFEVFAGTYHYTETEQERARREEVNKLEKERDIEKQKRRVAEMKKDDADKEIAVLKEQLREKQNTRDQYMSGVDKFTGILSSRLQAIKYKVQELRDEVTKGHLRLTYQNELSQMIDEILRT